MLRGNFIAGLKKDINTHVQLSNVATTEQALSVAVAFEKANTTTKSGSMSSAAKDETSIEAQIAALELQKQQHDGNKRQGNSGKLADEGCFFCEFIGHIKKVCCIKANEKSMGVFLPTSRRLSTRTGWKMRWTPGLRFTKKWLPTPTRWIQQRWL